MGDGDGDGVGGCGCWMGEQSGKNLGPIFLTFFFLYYVVSYGALYLREL